MLGRAVPELVAEPEVLAEALLQAEAELEARGEPELLRLLLPERLPEALPWEEGLREKEALSVLCTELLSTGEGEDPPERLAREAEALGEAELSTELL